VESVGCALGFLLWVAIVRFSPELLWSSIILPWPLSALLVGLSGTPDKTCLKLSPDLSHIVPRNENFTVLAPPRTVEKCYSAVFTPMCYFTSPTAGETPFLEVLCRS
jgi:hypothetical protein